MRRRTERQLIGWLGSRALIGWLGLESGEGHGKYSTLIGSRDFEEVVVTWHRKFCTKLFLAKNKSKHKFPEIRENYRKIEINSEKLLTIESSLVNTVQRSVRHHKNRKTSGKHFFSQLTRVFGSN